MTNITITKAICDADSLIPNDIPVEKKIEWLSAFDSRVRLMIIDKRENAPDTPFEGYTPDTDLSEPLACPEQNKDVYTYLLCTKICLETGDIARFNDMSKCFTAAFRLFRSSYAASHPRKTRTCMSF